MTKMCPKCGKNECKKTLVNGKERFRPYCSECRRQYERDRADSKRKTEGKTSHWKKPKRLLTDQEKIQRASEKKAKQSAYNSDYYDENSDSLKEYQREYRAKNADKLREYKKDYARRLKQEGIEAYDGACACCGETIPEFLTIEHKNGRKDEKKKLTGAKMWMKLKSLGWPKDEFELLCFNCNCAKGAYGECPHKRMKNPL